MFDAVNQTIEKMPEYQKPLYLTFVDYHKAFDCVEEHCYIWKSLKTQGVPIDAERRKFYQLFRNTPRGSLRC